MHYYPHSPNEISEMMDTIGISDLNELFDDIPNNLKLNRSLNLSLGMGEMEVQQKLRELSNKNITVNDCPSFLGAGSYDHFIPVAIDQLLMRSEFYTSYTPYQPEISQGILQSIFEYQSYVCRLTDMDVSNASMYDGASALGEACRVSSITKKRRKIVLAETLNPAYIQVVKTYAIENKMDVIIVPEKDGLVDTDKFINEIDERTSCAVIQQPNFYGLLEDVEPIEKKIHQVKGYFIMNVNPMSLGILKSPGEWGADFAVGDGQAFGNGLNFGGPSLGFFAAKKANLRQVPGRIVGQTQDSNGKTAYVLTLQAREQHIRREKASSNICSNQALNALAMGMYLTFVGQNGLINIATRCHNNAMYAYDMCKRNGIKTRHSNPFFMEFVVDVEDSEACNKKLLDNGIIGGYSLDKTGLLLAFTEKRTKNEIDKLVEILKGGESIG